MSDFERTFGAGADVVSIVDSLGQESDQPDTREQSIQVSCSKCGGRGKIRQYKHLDEGRCYACNGSGKVWAKPAPPKLTSTLTTAPRMGNADWLEMPLERVRAKRPMHDSFGILVPAFNKSCELIQHALDENGLDPIVSIGDIAKAFGAMDAVNHAIELQGISRLVMMSMLLPAAERAAEARMNHHLLSVARHARCILNDDASPGYDAAALVQFDADETPAKRCARALVEFARPGEVWSELYTYPPRWQADVLLSACEEIELAAVERGADGREAGRSERENQVQDILAISPLRVLGQRQSVT